MKEKQLDLRGLICADRAERIRAALTESGLGSLRVVVDDDAKGASRRRRGDGRGGGGRRTLVAGQDDVDFGSLPLDGGSPTQGGGCVPRVIGFGVVVDHDSQ